MCDKHLVIDKIKKLEIRDRENDVIVMTFDPDKNHFDEAATAFQMVEKKFPNHNFIETAKGIEFPIETIDNMIDCSFRTIKGEKYRCVIMKM